MAEMMNLIHEWYTACEKKWPTVEEALLWADTELGEAKELLLMEKGAWVRNNPDDKEQYSDGRFAEELGDVIVMLLVAARVKGVSSPLLSARQKLRASIKRAYSKGTKL